MRKKKKYSKTAIRRLIAIWQRRFATYNKVYYKSYHRRKPAKDFYKNFHQFLIIFGRETCQSKIKEYKKLLR